MPTLFFGIVVLVLVLWALNAFSKADPQIAGEGAAAGRRHPGALGARGVSGFARPARGRDPARAYRAWACSAGCRWRRPAWSQRTQKSPGQVSRVRSAFVEMELDHDTGAMRGTHPRRAACRARRSTRSIVPTLLGLLAEIDAESRALLAAYLDRREPGWREHAQDGAAAGHGRAASARAAK